MGVPSHKTGDPEENINKTGDPEENINITGDPEENINITGDPEYIETTESLSKLLNSTSF